MRKVLPLYLLIVGLAGCATTKSDALVSPFLSVADENMFWAVMNDAVDPRQVPRTPTTRLAFTLRACLSDKTPPAARTTLLQILLSSKFTADLDEIQLNELIGKLTDQNIAVRWSAMRAIVNQDEKMAALLKYVLNDEARMKEYFATQKNTAVTKPQD